MYQWYKNASDRFVYLSDVTTEIEEPWRAGVENVEHESLPSVYQQFAESQWFTRGWTLQELIAPKRVLFYDTKWQSLGRKEILLDPLAQITGVDFYVLEGIRDPSSVSVAKRMSWASARETAREEDMAYCLLGLFDVNMPMLYGEGKKAFVRLQEEILKTSDDHSIFAWTMFSPEDEYSFNGLLAESPAAFSKSSSIESLDHTNIGDYGDHEYSMTNKGLKITLQLIPWGVDVYLAPLRCHGGGSSGPLYIFLFDLKAPRDRFLRMRVLGESWTSLRDATKAEEKRTGEIRRDFWKIEEKTIYIPRKGGNSGRFSFYGFWIRSIRNAGIIEVYPEERWDSTEDILKMPPGPGIVTGVLLCGDEHVKFTVLLGFREDSQPFICIRRADSADPRFAFENVPEYEPKRWSMVTYLDYYRKIAAEGVIERPSNDGNHFRYAVDIRLVSI